MARRASTRSRAGAGCSRSPASPPTRRDLDLRAAAGPVAGRAGRDRRPPRRGERAPGAGRRSAGRRSRAPSSRRAAGGRHRRRRRERGLGAARSPARRARPSAVARRADRTCWSSPAIVGARRARRCAATPASRTSRPRSASPRSSCSGRRRPRNGGRRPTARATACCGPAGAATRTPRRPTPACSRSRSTTCSALCMPPARSAIAVDPAAHLLFTLTGATASAPTREDSAVAGDGYDPNGDDRLTEEFVEQWRGNAYGCFSSGHKFCREVCPVMQVTRNENHTPTAFHANIVAMEKGLVGVEDVADDFVHCTQCGACELRCPNTLMAGDFYRHRTRTVDVVKAMRALMVATGNEREGWKLWNERLAEGHNEPVLGEVPGQPGARRRLGRGPRHPGRRRDDPVRRLRGGVLPDLLHARVRAAAAGRRRRVRPDARAMVLRRAGRRDGLRRARAPARRPQRRRLARGRREAHHRSRPARLHRVHRGLPALLRRRLRVRDRPRRRAGQRPRQGGPDPSSRSRSSAP